MTDLLPSQPSNQLSTLRRMLDLFFKLPSVEKNNPIKSILFFGAQEKNEKVLHIFYQFTLSILIIYFFSAVIYIYALQHEVIINLAFTKTPSFEGRFVENFLRDYSYSIASIVYIFMVPFFYIKMKYNVSSYDFLATNPQWASKELQQKRKTHIIITLTIAFVSGSIGVFESYRGITYYTKALVEQNDKRLFVNSAIYFVFCFPCVFYMILRCLLSVPNIFHFSEDRV